MLVDEEYQVLMQETEEMKQGFIVSPFNCFLYSSLDSHFN